MPLSFQFGVGVKDPQAWPPGIDLAGSQRALHDASPRGHSFVNVKNGKSVTGIKTLWSW